MNIENKIKNIKDSIHYFEKIYSGELDIDKSALIQYLEEYKQLLEQDKEYINLVKIEHTVNDFIFDYFEENGFNFDIIVHKDVWTNDDIKKHLIDYITTNFKEQIEIINYEQWFLSYNDFSEEPNGKPLKEIINEMKSAILKSEQIGRDTIKYTYSFSINKNDEVPERD